MKDALEVTLQLYNKTATTGAVVVTKCTLGHRPSFIDYLKGGCELNFMIGIDFTASNGNPR